MPDDSSRIFKSSALEQFFLISLFDADRSSFLDLNKQMVVQSNYRGGLIEKYIWDTRVLSESLTGKKINIYPNVVEKNNSYWSLFFTNSVRISNDNSYIEGLPTFNPIAAFAKLSSNKLFTSTQFNISPVTKGITSDEVNDNQNLNEILKTQSILYKAFILPGCPLLFASTLRDEIYGPQFVSKISITGKSNSSVDLTLETTGAKTMYCNQKEVTSFLNQNSYRTLRNYDCQVEFQIFPSANDFFNYIKTKRYDTSTKLEEISLTVSNTLDTTVTAVSGNDSMQLGPRYFNVSKRTVEGSLTFISKSSEFIDINYRENKGLTLYFGSQFLFSMPNVEFMKPTIKSTGTNDLFVHEYKFIAFACDNALSNAYLANSLGYLEIAEFLLPEDNYEMDWFLMMKMLAGDFNKKKKNEEEDQQEEPQE
jgi:hypothetical protein